MPWWRYICERWMEELAPKIKIKKHIGAVNSAHAGAQEKYDRFTTPTTSIRESITSNTT